ncbi:transposable element Tcb2 transposase [Trichonephila clavipes]|nr:transposable element Tcb2 transposase [Trichonephila clavipes]
MQIVFDRWNILPKIFCRVPLVRHPCCQVIYSQFGLAIHQNDHQARRRFVEWAQNEIAVVPDFHKRILFSDEAHFWLNGYVNKQNCRIWSEANPQVARATIDLLKDTFGDRLVSRFGPVNWPPRSCDLTPLDYFLWDYVKSLVYAEKPQTLDHLEDNIRRVIADIRPQMLENSSKIGHPDWTTSEPAGVVGRLEGGQTQAEIAQAIGVSQSVISRIWNRFLETGSAGRRPRQGRRRATTPNEDRYLVLTARRHRNMNATLLQQHLRSITGNRVSTQTVRNRLHGVGLYARRPMVCVRLTSRHRRDRREWATEHVNWRRNEWSNVLFSDESRFSVQPDIIGVFSSGETVAVGIILRSCTKMSDLAVGECWCPHRANLVEDFLFEEGIVRIEWPACSPDMNLIEQVWDALGRRFSGRQPPPQTLQELERALLEEWDRIPQLGINSLIDSIP